MDYLVTKNLNHYKYQGNEDINSEHTFDTSSFNLSSGTSNTLPVVTVSLRGRNKHRAATVAGIACLWDRRANEIMINIRHTKNYELKMQSNKVEYSTATDVYCTTHDVKVPFFMPEFSSSKIINRSFHVDNEK